MDTADVALELWIAGVGELEGLLWNQSGSSMRRLARHMHYVTRLRRTPKVLGTPCQQREAGLTRALS